MDTALKLAGLLLLVTLLPGGVAAKNEAGNTAVFKDAKIRNYPPRILLKNWAMSICIANIAKGTAIGTDAAKTANGFAEYAVLSIEERDEMLPLINKYIAQKYGGRTEIGEKPSDFNTMKCIDLFHSAELDALIGKFLEERPRERE